jgi:transcriptional regulator with XRE-family HTH domain
MNLSKLILKAGYTPQMLADAVGVSRNAIYSYISGSSYPRAENLMAICKTLGYSEKTVLAAIKEARNDD